MLSRIFLLPYDHIRYTYTYIGTSRFQTSLFSNNYSWWGGDIVFNNKNQDVYSIPTPPANVLYHYYKTLSRLLL